MNESTTTNTETPTAGYSQPADSTPAAEPTATYTTESAPAAVPMRRLKLGRHPQVTAGAFGNGRKHNGIKFRRSALISRYV